MPIKLPVETAFYYEATYIRDRLLYCIPSNRLRSLIDQQRSGKAILEEYPDGVDIKVSSIHFREIREKYRMALPEDPDGLYYAFKFLREKTDKKKFPKTGFIRESYLFELHDYLYENLGSEFWRHFPGFEYSFDHNIKMQKRILKSRYTNDGEVINNFKKLDLPGYDPKLSIIEQGFSKIEMGDGEEPFSFISKIKQK